MNCVLLEVQRLPGPDLVGDPSGLLTASFGCSGLGACGQRERERWGKGEGEGEEEGINVHHLESRYTKVISTAYIEISSSKVSDHFWTKNHPHWQQLEWHWVGGRWLYKVSLQPHPLLLLLFFTPSHILLISYSPFASAPVFYSFSYSSHLIWQLLSIKENICALCRMQLERKFEN